MDSPCGVFFLFTGNFSFFGSLFFTGNVFSLLETFLYWKLRIEIKCLSQVTYFIVD